MHTIFVLAVVSVSACGVNRDGEDGIVIRNGKPVRRGAYLGQTAPGMTAELFAPGVVSTGGTEILASFTPDGKCFYHTIMSPRSQGCVLVRRMLKDGAWGPPEVASFSGRHSDFGSAVAPDGRRLFFVSNQPRRAGEAVQESQDIWVVERTDDGWSEPTNLGPPVNSDGRDLAPCPVANGSLYFNSNRGGSRTVNRMDIYRSRLVEGRYSEPENLSSLIPIPFDNFEPAVPADERYLVFVAASGPASRGEFDLYVTFSDGRGGWSEPKNLGPTVNTDANEHFPTLSPDGRFLFFVSDRVAAEFGADRRMSYVELRRMEAAPQNGKSDIYWVSTELIERIRLTP